MVLSWSKRLSLGVLQEVRKGLKSPSSSREQGLLHMQLDETWKNIFKKNNNLNLKCTLKSVSRRAKLVLQCFYHLNIVLFTLSPAIIHIIIIQMQYTKIYIDIIRLIRMIPVFIISI